MRADKPMRQRYIFGFWLPLFASWLLMSAEGPIVSAAINRLPNEVIMLAAMGIVTSLSVTIESPIINLLSTATALTQDWRTFVLLRRFTLHWILLLTGVSAALAFTPLFDLVVVRAMGTPPAVAEWVRPGMQIMLFWTAAIGWRRFLQGVLIRFGYTRRLAWGTAVRLAASGGTAIALALWSGWPGVVVGACALMAGVLAEALFATLAVRPVLHHELHPDSPLPPEEPGRELTYRELFWFHLPLAATSLLTLLAQPLVAFSLARLANPTNSLAAWPLIFQMLLLTRAAAFALPEVVIALTRRQDNYAPIRRFSLTLAAASLAGTALVTMTPLLSFYIFVVQDTTPEVGELARLGMTLFLFLPAITVLISWLRGLLISRRATRDVNLGMAINLSLTAVVLFAGLAVRWPGIPTAAVALNLAALAEMLYLFWRVRRLPGFGGQQFGNPADPQFSNSASQPVSTLTG